MLKIARFLKNYKKQVILGPIFKLIEAIFELIVPMIMAKIIDYGVHNKDINYVLKMGFILILIGIISFSSAVVCQKYASVASQGFGTTVRNELFTHINTFSYKEIDKFGTSSLITRITNDVNQLQLAVAMLIRLVIRAPFLAIGAIIMAMILDLNLSIIFLISTPLITLILYVIIRNSIPYFQAIQKKLDAISLATRENLDGVRVIRAFSNQKNELNKFNIFSEDLSTTAIRVGKLSSLLNPLTYIILNLSIIAIIWFGGIRVNSGNLSQGQIIAFVNYITQILLALIVVSNLVVIFTKASASASRVNELFDTSSSIKNEENLAILELTDNSIPRIEFKNVSFSYDDSKNCSLTNISVQIYPNEVVGIIGGTGSGKSTLINLICRFYDVSMGNIFINGLDIKNYPLSQIRNIIKIVPQHSVLFTGTIEDNIKFGNSEATSADLEKYLNIAQASEFVDKLSDGYQTKLNQGGKNLSGGQKQRLAIARAIICTPEILILDDSFSALDFSTDAKLRSALKDELKNNATLIIASQRVSTIKNADKILVLDDGFLVDAGTHEELSNRCEIYKEITHSQNKSDL